MKKTLALALALSTFALSTAHATDTQDLQVGDHGFATLAASACLNYADMDRAREFAAAGDNVAYNSWLMKREFARNCFRIPTNTEVIVGKVRSSDPTFCVRPIGLAIGCLWTNNGWFSSNAVASSFSRDIHLLNLPGLKQPNGTTQAAKK